MRAVAVPVRGRGPADGGVGGGGGGGGPVCVWEGPGAVRDDGRGADKGADGEGFEVDEGRGGGGCEWGFLMKGVWGIWRGFFFSEIWFGCVVGEGERGREGGGSEMGEIRGDNALDGVEFGLEVAFECECCVWLLCCANVFSVLGYI